MNKALLDFYSDCLLSSFSQVTATGLSRLLAGEVSHYQVTPILPGEKLTSKSWWRLVKPFDRQVEPAEGVMIIDDTIIEKPYPDEK